VNREQKIVLTEKMNKEFQGTPHVIFSTFSGLTVNQDTELRAKIRGVGGQYSVIKNRLAKRAAVGTPIEPLLGQFQGPCALALHESDPVSLAKTLSEFAKDNPQVELRAALIDAKELLDAAGVKQLAALPGLQELRGQLLSLVQMPATMLVRLLNTPGTQVARVLDAKAGEGES